MKSKTAPHTLILASASPRRKALLEQINITPKHIIPADIDESEHKDELPRAAAERLAREKSQKVYQALSAHLSEEERESAYILSADTLVAVGRRILPKTEDEQSTVKCLELLSGRAHHVYGGMALITPEGKLISRLIDTKVHFKRLSTQDIDTYLKTKEWQGVAGGYAIQGYASAFIKSISGSYSNVVGLSLYDTMNLLDGNGFVQ